MRRCSARAGAADGARGAWGAGVAPAHGEQGLGRGHTGRATFLPVLGLHTRGSPPPLSGLHLVGGAEEPGRPRVPEGPRSALPQWRLRRPPAHHPACRLGEQCSWRGTGSRSRGAARAALLESLAPGRPPKPAPCLRPPGLINTYCTRNHGEQRAALQRLMNGALPPIGHAPRLPCAVSGPGAGPVAPGAFPAGPRAGIGAAAARAGADGAADSGPAGRSACGTAWGSPGCPLWPAAGVGVPGSQANVLCCSHHISRLASRMLCWPRCSQQPRAGRAPSSLRFLIPGQDATRCEHLGRDGGSRLGDSPCS